MSTEAEIESFEDGTEVGGITSSGDASEDGVKDDSIEEMLEDNDVFESPREIKKEVEQREIKKKLRV